jgi:hypothetical protein
MCGRYGRRAEKQRIAEAMQVNPRGCFDFCVSDCSSILEGNRWKSIKS